MTMTAQLASTETRHGPGRVGEHVPGSWAPCSVTWQQSEQYFHSFAWVPYRHEAPYGVQCSSKTLPPLRIPQNSAQTSASCWLVEGHYQGGYSRCFRGKRQAIGKQATVGTQAMPKDSQ